MPKLYIYNSIKSIFSSLIGSIQLKFNINADVTVRKKKVGQFLICRWLRNATPWNTKHWKLDIITNGSHQCHFYILIWGVIKMGATAVHVHNNWHICNLITILIEILHIHLKFLFCIPTHLPASWWIRGNQNLIAVGANFYHFLRIGIFSVFMTEILCWNKATQLLLIGKLEACVCENKSLPSNLSARP